MMYKVYSLFFINRIPQYSKRKEIYEIIIIIIIVIIIIIIIIGYV